MSKKYNKISKNDIIELLKRKSKRTIGGFYDYITFRTKSIEKDLKTSYYQANKYITQLKKEGLLIYTYSYYGCHCNPNESVPWCECEPEPPFWFYRTTDKFNIYITNIKQ